MEGLQAAEVAGEVRMALTRAFKETVQARIRQDRKYREELLREGVECLLAGDLDTGKAILRDYINATIGFEKLSRLTGRPAKSLMRMLGPRGNPQARNLFEVIGQLQRIEGLHFELSLRAAS
jgi:DNA-binding phage protein